MVTLRFSKPLSDTTSSISVTRSSISSSGTLWFRRPKAMLSYTSRCGNSAYFWNTVFTCRLYGGMSLILTPSNKTSPEVGLRNPPIILSVVVLPHPEGPNSVRNSLLLMYRLMESRTVSPSKAMVQSTRRMSSLAIILPLFSRFFALCALGQSYRFQGGLSMQFSFSNQIIFCAARDAKNCRKRAAFRAALIKQHKIVFGKRRSFGYAVSPFCRSSSKDAGSIPTRS